MQVLTGTKREISMKQWQELIDNRIKEINDGAECFRRFHETDDLDSMIEHCKQTIKDCESAKQAIHFMNEHNIL